MLNLLMAVNRERTANTLNRLLFSLVIFISLALHCQAARSEQPATGGECGYHKTFKGIEHWTKVFDDPARDKWQRPAEVIAALAIQKNETVADIGAGTGYFAFRIARSEPRAKIYAADAEPDMVDYLKEQAAARNLPNVIPFKIAAATPDLPEKINLALIVDTYHHMDNRVEYLKALKALLLEQGRVAIIDFTEESPEGPPKEHRLKKSRVIGEFADAGFVLATDLQMLPNQYFLIFRPGSEK